MFYNEGVKGWQTSLEGPKEAYMKILLTGAVQSFADKKETVVL